jgi:hypothetical protein
MVDDPAPGPLRGDALLAWIASRAPRERDRAVEGFLGLQEAPAAAAAPPGEDLIGYQPAGVAPVVHALVEVPVGPEDVLVDLGSGLGKVALLAHLVTGCVARGIEIAPALVRGARAAAARIGAEVHFTEDDARTSPLDDGTVFFLYLPFSGAALAEMVLRLEAVARRRAIVVCALGVDARAPWLVPRPLDAFWLTIYDSALDGAAPRASAPLVSAGRRALAERIALERA